MTIRVEQLRVALGGRTVIDGVDAALGGGALVGVVGPNGAGKSTLLRAMLALLRPERGHVFLDGEDVGKTPRGTIARRIAYLPQGQALHWPLAVERLVALGRIPHLAPLSRMRAADHHAVTRALERADAAHLVGRVATELSGGERARVLLARALAVEAPVLLADEPLAALDPGHQIATMRLLGDLARDGALVLAVLHDVGLAARHCDRLMLLHQGRLVADGAPADVLSEERLADIYGVRAWRGFVEGAPMLVPIAPVR